LVAGLRGVARIGGDYWDGIWTSNGFKKPSGNFGNPGLPCAQILWPGKEGTESSVRMEIMREGMQEGEVRVFLEQAIERLTQSKETAHTALVKRIEQVLDHHSHETMIISARTPYSKIGEYCTGWQERSKVLYSTAAEAGKVLGADVDLTPINTEIPARGKVTVPVAVRNWSSKPRKWILTGSDPWIVPEVQEGTLAPGRRVVKVVLDGSALTPESNIAGKLIFKDAVSGRTETVAVNGTVSPVLTLMGLEKTFEVAGIYNWGKAKIKPVMSIEAKGKDQLNFTVYNSSGKTLSWKLEAHRVNGSSKPVTWLKARPSSGDLKPGGMTDVVVEAEPPGTARETHHLKLTLSESGGVKQEADLTVHLLPAPITAQSRPGNTGIKLEQVSKTLIKKYVHCGKEQKVGGGRTAIRFWQPRKGRPDKKLAIGKKEKTYTHGFGVNPRTEILYSLDSKEYKAFAVEVGPDFRLSKGIRSQWMANLKLHFEVYVDNKLAAHSGLMELHEAPKLLVVQGLDKAKTLKLITRVASGANVGNVAGVWGNPELYK
jgi:hypothetical protein